MNDIEQRIRRLERLYEAAKRRADDMESLLLVLGPALNAAGRALSEVPALPEPEEPPPEPGACLTCDMPDIFLVFDDKVDVEATMTRGEWEVYNAFGTTLLYECKAPSFGWMSNPYLGTDTFGTFWYRNALCCTPATETTAAGTQSRRFRFASEAAANDLWMSALAAGPLVVNSCDPLDAQASLAGATAMVGPVYYYEAP